MIAELAATPAAVEPLLLLTAGDLRRHPQGDSWHVQGHHVRWSLLQHLCHLRDLEREGYGPRLARLVDEVHPWFADVDGDRLAAERDYDAEDPRRAWEDFRAARAASLRTAAALRAAKRDPGAVLAGVGEISFERLLGFMAEHDRGHLAMIGRLRDHWRGHPAPRA